jgi:hypothetical protein
VLSGQYAFSLSGSNGTGFQLVAGAFTADGTGKITTGEADVRNMGGSGTTTINPATSSYSVGADNRGCATLATTLGTFTTRFVLGTISGTTAAAGRIIEFEPPSSSAYIASGELFQQNSSVFSGGLSGSYAFGWTGWDPDELQAADAVGVMSASGGQITSFQMTVNDGGTIIPTAPGVITGTYSSFDSSGRATVSYTSANGTGSATFYMASASKLLYIQMAGTPAVVGDVQQQAVPKGGFTNSSVNGNMVLYGGGANGTSAEDSFLGLVNSTGSGTLTVSVYEDDGSNNRGGGTGWQSLGTASTYTCSYSVGANGEVSLSGTDPHCAEAPVFFLTAPNTAYLLGQTAPLVQLGAIEPQAAITFNNSTLSGDFFTGSLGAIGQNLLTEVEQLALGNGSGTSVADITSTTSQAVDQSGTLSYTVNADGTVTTIINSVPVVQIVVINNNRFVTLNNVTGTNPYIMVGQQ